MHETTESNRVKRAVSVARPAARFGEVFLSREER